MRRACLGVDLETCEFCGENAREFIKGIFEVLLQNNSSPTLQRIQHLTEGLFIETRF